MKGPIAYMARNHVAANMLMFVFLVGGIMTASRIKQEVFPEFDLDIITIQVAYPGATPSEVEDAVVRPVELAVSGVDNVKRVTATANEGFGTITLEVLEGANSDQVVQDAKNEVDRITTFPEEAEEPVISKLNNRDEVVTLMVYGDAGERALREQADIVKDDLLAMPNITQVDLSAFKPYEISVEISEDNLRKYNLTLDRVASIIRQSSLDLAGGSFRASSGEVLIRTVEKRRTGIGLDTVAVLTRPDGRRVLLSDIATVVDGFAELDQEARFNGHPAIMVKVYRVGEQTPIEVARTVRGYIEERNAQLPQSVQLAIWQDSSDTLQSRLNLLLKNGTLGLILVLLILTLFLEVRLALWVALGIAISFAGSLLLMPAWNASINMISLFGFLIILGVAVDDAIVVGENVYVHRKMGKSLYNAAVDGTREITMAVVFAGLTTIAAFGPLLFVGGFVGKFMWNVPAIVISVLVISLIESILILPAHLNGRLIASEAPIWKKIEKQRSKMDRFVKWMIDHTYTGTLEWATRRRYTTLSIAIAILLITAGIVGGGLIKFTFMPEVDADEVTAILTMPPGTPFEETERIVKHIESTGQELIAEVDADRDDGRSNMKYLFTVIGQSTQSNTHRGSASNQNTSNLAEIHILLTDPDHRTISTSDLAYSWSQRVGDVAGIEKLSFSSDLIGRGTDISLQLSHADYNVLLEAVERMKGAFEKYAGVTQVSDSHSEGKRELRLKLRPDAANQGIREADLARQVRSAFYGAEAMRIQRGQNEVKVMVRYPDKDRRTLATIDQMRIRTADGREVPFSQAAYVDEGRGYSQIQRADRRRVINVTAEINRSVANADEILEDMQATVIPQLLADYPGLSFDFEGSSRDQRESMAKIQAAFLFGILLIYGLLAVPFQSFTQPLIVMSAIPFGIVGAIGGHLLLGFSISMMSLFGIVALTGVVVNSSLVLIDFINRHKEDGQDSKSAVMEAGKRRFRPIVMTATTTFFGLVPMILETSIQAKFLVPMAVSLGFGVLFSTFITLVLVPSLYLILEDIGSLLGRTQSKKKQDIRAGDGNTLLTDHDGVAS